MTGFSNERCRVTLASAGLLSVLLQGSVARAEDPAPSSVYTDEGRLGHVRAGPTVGVGAPDGVRLGAFAKWRGLLAGGVALSLLPNTKVTGLDATVTRVSGEAFARMHPLRGALFLGIAGGVAQTKGTTAGQITAFNQVQGVESHAYAQTIYLAPQVGFQWMLPKGFTLGFDVGVEVPLFARAPTFDAAKYGLVTPIEGKGKAADAARYVATNPLPVLHFLEIGCVL